MTLVEAVEKLTGVVSQNQKDAQMLIEGVSSLTDSVQRMVDEIALIEARLSFLEANQ